MGKKLGWMTGKTAYFVNGGEIIPVVINEGRNGKVKAVIVGHEATGGYYTLDTVSQKRLFDTLKKQKNS